MANLGSMFDADESAAFLGLPSATLADLQGADIVVMGAPCATPYLSVGPYCKEAPAAIRAASSAYSRTRDHHTFDLGVQDLKGGMYFWVAPMKNPDQVEAVYTDRIFLVQEK